MIRKVLPHLLIVLSIVLLTLLITDQFNSAMGFVNNQGTKIIMMIYCGLVVWLSILFARGKKRRK